MHELGIAASIVEACAERAGARRVVRVVLEIGELSCVLPDAIRFCFDVASEGTQVEGAALDVVRIPAAGRCGVCGADVPLPHGYGACPCGAPDVQLARGNELRVRQMEVV